MQIKIVLISLFIPLTQFMLSDFVKKQPENNASPFIVKFSVVISYQAGNVTPIANSDWLNKKNWIYNKL